MAFILPQWILPPEPYPFETFFNDRYYTAITNLKTASKDINIRMSDQEGAKKCSSLLI